MILTLEQLDNIFDKKILKISKNRVVFEGGPSVSHKAALNFVTPDPDRYPKGFPFLNGKELIPMSLGCQSVDRSPKKSSGIPESYAKMVPVIDMKTEETYMLDRDTGEIREEQYGAWISVMGEEGRSCPITPVYIEYNPYERYSVKEKKVMDDDSIPALYVNRYKLPTWREIPKESVLIDGKVSLPKEAEQFFLHLFPDPLSREYVYFWIQSAILLRNETFLILNGSKGIGKNVLATVIKHLVGEDNYGAAPQSLQTSHFNSVLKDKRVIFLDEFCIRDGSGGHNLLKLIANEYQTIERKGFDANKLEKIFNSYIIANNDVTDMFVEWDDRRFSVVEMTTKDLKTSMKEADITKFCNELLKDDRYLAQIGYFILEGRKHDFQISSPLKTNRFYEMVYGSLPEWKKFLIEKWATGAPCLPIKNLKTEFENKNGKDVKFPNKKETIEDFLKNYRHEGKYYLGEYKIEPNSNKPHIYFTSKDDVDL